HESEGAAPTHGRRCRERGNRLSLRFSRERGNRLSREPERSHACHLQGGKRVLQAATWGRKGNAPAPSPPPETANPTECVMQYCCITCIIGIAAYGMLC